MEHLKYPIGKFTPQSNYTLEQINEYIKSIKLFPAILLTTVDNISNDDFKKQYREGSWNICQLIHHIGESHLNAYMRIKLALTEENPTIKPYNENSWVNTSENKILDFSVSIKLIEAIHEKFSCLAGTLCESDLKRTFFHPQNNRTFSIADMLCLYSWHGNHHLAHIKIALGIN
ncbi:MAG: putative metal-dependent hydrolase [Bacteroidia bacterium]|nr:putative metal-dependent hydrolase [Bacteroidia bacterium]